MVQNLIPHLRTYIHTKDKASGVSNRKQAKDKMPREPKTEPTNKYREKEKRQREQPGELG